MLKIYCLLTGDDYELVKSDTPASKRKVALLATCLLVPVIMWFINSVLLVHEVLIGSSITAIVSGIIVALIIFLIERAVIMSNGSRTIAVFRVCLGLIVAILGSIALDEVVFKSDIDQQVAENKQAMIQQDVLSVDTQLRENISKKKSIADARYLEWQKSNEEVINEMKGGAGSSGIKGKGNIANENIRIAEIQQNEYEKAKTELHDAEKAVENEKQKVSAQVEENYNSHSLLNRIKAMFTLVLSDKWMGFIYLTFTLFLVALEFLVVIIKMCSGETNYERKIKAIDRIGCERIGRIENKDLVFFDPSRFNQTVKRAKIAIEEPSPAIFS